MRTVAVESVVAPLAFIIVACAPATGQSVTADQVVAHYIAARGGLDRLNAIQTIIYRGAYHEGSFTMDNAAMSLMRPYYKLVGDAKHPSSEFGEGYDGSSWEFYGDPGVVLRTVGAASAATRHGVYIGGSLAGYKQRGWAVTFAGVTPVGGRKAYRLVVRMADGYEEEELIDTETWLLIAERKTMAIHAFGAAVTSETRFSDYRPVAGVLFSFSEKEVEIATGRELNEMRWSSIEVNPSVDSVAFSPPIFAHAPLQTMLEQLYQERADSSAVMWSYRDFRAAHGAIDTHDGIEFIGYQMVKMQDLPGALALLSQNAADYPKDAAAAFGLGRAYAAAGRTDLARSNYHHALDLDPNYKPAKRALDALGGPPG